jgi:hypothetical protein
MKMNHFSRGQATIELLLILAVLFIVLGFALQTYSTNQLVVNQKKSFLDAERNASIVRTAIEATAYAPIGSFLRVFVPPASQNQDIRLINGTVEVRTDTILIELPTLQRDLNSFIFHDGNIIVISRTPSGVILS